MKTTSKKREKTEKVSTKRIRRKDLPDEEVAVIVDVRSGAEFYMFVIDSFAYGKNNYTVMVPYEPDRINAKDSDLIILRSHQAKNGDQLYVSISDKKELDGVFEMFYSRFEESAKSV